MIKKLLISMTIWGLASHGWAMGSPKPKTRVLKKKVEVGHLSARPFTIPGGGSFDFEAAVNAQVVTVLQASGKYTFRNPTNPLTGFTGNVPSCVIDIPQYRVEGSVTGFEFLSSFGIRFGYTPSGDLNGVSGEVGVQVDTAQMDLTMMATDYLSRFVAASTNVDSNQTKTKVDATINFKDFHLGPEFYLSTPLAKVSEKGLSKAITKLAEQTDKIPWEARVLEDQDLRVWVNAGSRSGLVVGDELEIFNLEHRWEGLPCMSRYQGAIPSEKPVAIIRLTNVGDDVSTGTPIVQTDINPQPGAKVVVHKLVPVK